MPFIYLLFILFSSHLGQAAIYGADNRRDIVNVPMAVRTASQAVAANIPSFYFLSEQNSDQLMHENHGLKYGEEADLCVNERFTRQTSFGHCTGFLVHQKILITAGHCLIPTGTIENQENPYCDNFSFWLGYNKFHNPRLGRDINPQNVVRCKKVIYAKNNEMVSPIMDFAILELEESIPHIQPLEIGADVTVGESVYALGHPHGLPLKHSGKSKVRQVAETSFSAFLDTLGGNSGGPVLNDRNQVVGILVAGHQNDFYTDQACSRINRCDENGESCKNPSSLDPANHMIKMSQLKPHIDSYLQENGFESL